MFSFVSADLTTDIESYWKFDGDATDSVGSNDGTVSGATYTASGKINGAYSFDGTDYMTISDDFNFIQNTGDFTISAWVKLDSVSADRAEIFLASGSLSSSEKAMG